MAALADAPLDGEASVARDVLRLTVENLPLPSAAPAVATRPGPRMYRARLRGVLDVHSLLFRHAIRLAVVVAAAQALAFVDPYEKSYWIPLAAVVVLRPDLGSTITRGMQRLAGTIVGVTIAFAIVTLGDDREWALIAGFVLVSGLMGAVFDVNYALAVAALTPAVILLLSIEGGGPGLEIARLGGTLVGGGLALAGGLLLWPVWERNALGPALADGAAGEARYLEQIVDRSHAVDQVRSAHRDAERARSAAEGMLQRMLSEPRRHWIAAAEVTDYCTRLQTLVESTTELRAATRRVRPEAGQDDADAAALRERLARSVASLDEACDALSGTAARHLDGPVGPIADPPVDPTPDRPADPIDTSAGSRCHPDRALDLLVARIEHATSGLCRAADQVAAALATSHRADDADPSI
jgi:uncharacterized membrane protein YccC